jgi:hypothetical protein
VLGTLWPSAAAGQGSLFERLNLDRLQLSALGGGFGRVQPSGVVPADAYAIDADYGEITRNVRVVFHVTYWESRFDDETVLEFENRLRSEIIDPSGDDTIRVGRIDVSDIALEADFRWTPFGPRFLRPYVGTGLGAHVINAESPFISGTVVEQALDIIAAGFAGFAGLDIVVGRLSVGAQARYNLLSTVRFGSLRAVGRFEFKRPGRESSR